MDPGGFVSAVARFIVVVGIDGSGKSTLLSQVGVPGVVACDWHELRDYEFMQPLVPHRPTAVKRRLSPLSRAMFIGGHLVGQYECLVRPRLAQGWSVALDSYYYKVLAKEELYGVCHSSLRELCLELPQPDCVIFVDVDPAISYARKKGRLSPYEYFNSPNLCDYYNFQSQLRDKILNYLDDVPLLYRLDGDERPERLGAQFESLIASHIGSPGRMELDGDRRV